MNNLKVFKPFTASEKNLVKIIFEKVELVTKIKKEKILSKNKTTNIVMVRMIIATILRNEALFTLMKIGRCINRDHSSVIYCVNRHAYNLNFPYYNKTYFDVLDRMVFSIKKTDIDFIDTEIERAISKVNNLKHKKKLIIWATRRYEARSL